MSKYKVEFGFSHEEVGYEIIDFCKKNINIKNDPWVKIMLDIIQWQIEEQMKEQE